MRNFYQTVTFSPIFKITKIAETVSNRWKLRGFMRVGTGLASLANELHETATRTGQQNQGGAMMKNRTCVSKAPILLLVGALFTSGCAGGPLTTREKGAGIGALGGAAAGGLIGSAVGHPGAGAAIGGALGLGTGALVGDQLLGQEQRQSDQQRQIDANQAELDRQRRELERVKKQGEY